MRICFRYYIYITLIGGGDYSVVSFADKEILEEAIGFMKMKREIKRKMELKLVLMILVLVLASLSGCTNIENGDGDENGDDGNGSGGGALTSIVITADPPLGTPPNIEIGQSVVFTAEGKDADGNTVPIPDAGWYSDGIHGTIVVDPNNPNKCTYTATNAGADYMQCCDGPPGTGIHGSVDFTVIGGGTSVPTFVVMIPETVTITPGDSVTFTVTTWDQNHQEMPDEPVTFTSTGGTITPEGVYTGEEIGEQTVTVKVTSNPSITDTSIVTVEAGQ